QVAVAFASCRKVPTTGVLRGRLKIGLRKEAKLLRRVPFEAFGLASAIFAEPRCSPAKPWWQLKPGQILKVAHETRRLKIDHESEIFLGLGKVEKLPARSLSSSEISSGSIRPLKI